MRHMTQIAPLDAGRRSRPAQPRRHGRRAIILAGLSVLALLLAACGTTSSAGSGGSSDASTGSGTLSSLPSGVADAIKADLAKYSAGVNQDPTVKPVTGAGELKGKTVWYVPIGASVPILAAFGTGLQQALSQLDIKMHTCDGKLLPTDMAACLNEAVTQGADAVVTGYIDYKLIPNAFNNLVAHNIPVLVAGASNDSGKPQTAKMAFYDTTSDVNLTLKLEMESVIANSGGKAKILFVGVLDSPQLVQGSGYARQFVKENCPGCSFTEIDYDTAAITQVPSKVSAALIANPGTTYVVDESDAAGPGTLQGLEAAGYAHKVKMAGTNADLDGLQRIKAGSVQFADVGASPIYFGWLFADGIVTMLTGALPVAYLDEVRVFTKDNVADLELTPAAYATNSWYGSNDFESGFRTAWGLP
jgi:ABC-type sugar transport system substrate-binding protein